MRIRNIANFLVLIFLAGCGGNSGSGSTNSQAPTTEEEQVPTVSDEPATLARLEQILLPTTHADGTEIDGIWLLAQERVTHLATNSSSPLFDSARPEHLFRSDIITLQRSGNLVIARYCANGAKPLFEGAVTDHQFFDIKGDGYFLPSRETFRGHLTGDGTRIEFTPDHFDNPDTGSGQVRLRAYKLTELSQTMPLGHWQTPEGSLAIDCMTVIDTHTYNADQQVDSRQRHFSISAESATLSIQQRLEKNHGTSFQLTEVISEKASWTAEQLEDESLDMYDPLRYQGTYQPPGGTARSFIVHLRSQ